jgi:hypothetical protein
MTEKPIKVVIAEGYQVCVCQRGIVHILMLDENDEPFASITLENETEVNELIVDLQNSILLRGSGGTTH